MRTRGTQFGLWAVAAALSGSLFLIACGGGGGTVSPPKPTPSPPLTIVTTSLSNGVGEQPYSQQLEAKGGNPPYIWSLASDSGPLPPGLILNSSGLLSGTPDLNWPDAEVYRLRIQVKDSISRTERRWFEMVVYYKLEITTESLAEGNVGLPYESGITITGGNRDYSVSLAPESDPLPSGLYIEHVAPHFPALIKGIPTQWGTFRLVLRVQDSGTPQQTADRRLDLIIRNALVITTPSLPIGVKDWPYRESIGAAGGNPPYTWSGIDPLPPGLTLSSSGEVSGTPTREGTYSFRVQIADSSASPEAITGYVGLQVRPPLTLTTTTLADGVIGNSYWSYIYFYGGRPPFSIRVVSGGLPPGVGFSSTTAQYGYFTFQGTPTEKGRFPFAVEVADSSSPSATVTCELTISIYERLELTTTSLPEGWTGDRYSATLSATGGLPPYTWGLVSYPSLPVPGLSLNPSTGEISGIPTAAYDDSLIFYVRDSANPAQQDWSYYIPLRIIGRLGVTTTRLPAGKANAPYRVQLGLFGGTAPYAWSITSGSLPHGLSLNASNGNITGTPTVEGTSNFTVHVTDTGPPVQTASRQLSLTITSSLGRNDAVATATSISNGTFRASISPYADPVSGPAYPDNDYYVLTANPGAIVTMETVAGRLLPASPLDSVIEIVDSAGARFNTCRAPDYPYGPYNLPCLNDDLDPGYTLDSKLEFQVPGTGSEPVTFYIHVLDWRGSARPDFVYTLYVFGAN